MAHPSLQIIRREHRAIEVVLESLAVLVGEGPDEEPVGYFDTLRAMLFYLEEFPERLHHKRESDVLFPKVQRVAPELSPLIAHLDQQHRGGASELRQLQNLLLACELIGDERRPAMMAASHAYVLRHLEHIHVEETRLLSVAECLFTAADWRDLDEAFERFQDPMGGSLEVLYDRLFSRVAATVPTSIATAMGRAIARSAAGFVPA